jgi:diguanylate cyclase (GGDEF)-like protein
MLVVALVLIGASRSRCRERKITDSVEGVDDPQFLRIKVRVRGPSIGTMSTTSSRARLRPAARAGAAANTAATPPIIGSGASQPGAIRTGRGAARWAPMALAMAALLAVYAGWQLLRWPAGQRTLIGDVFFYPVGVAAVGAALAAARRCRHEPRLRATWRWLAAAACVYLLGDIAQTFYELAGSKPYPSVGDGFYLLYYPCMLIGLLRVSARAGNVRQRVRVGLDLSVVAVAGIAVVIYVVLGPTVVQTGSDSLQTAFSVAYPVGDMVLLVGLGSVLVRGTSRSSARALQFMAAGLALYVVADLISGYITLHSTYHGGDPVDAVWMVAIALFAVAGAAQEVPDSPTEGAEPGAARRASWVPYSAVTVGFGLLLFNERHDAPLTNGIVVYAAVLLTGLVSIRQFLAQRDLVSVQDQLSHQSLHDPLTGLPNRVLIIDRAGQLLARARRHGRAIAALYVDLDGFKRVNDSFGHAVGDELLRAVAHRLSQTVRDSDTVARLGGDEFVILLEDGGDTCSPQTVAERICEALAEPMELGAGDCPTLTITASVGIAVGLEGTADDLLRDADYALYEAKRAGRNRSMTFESHMHSSAQDRIELEIDLRDALARGELFLLYQPLVDLGSETVTGVEALIRWRHDVRGVVPPGAFIDVAEDTGLIVEIGRWVLQTACRRAARWQQPGRPIGVAVNVSAVQLDGGDLIADVAGALRDSGLDPELLTLEITETTLMRDAAAAARQLSELKALGVRIAIDDFGTGYSSLAYLGQFPVDALKVDRSFVARIATSSESRALVHALVQLAKALGLETVGEGIEEIAQLRYLQREGCAIGQGFMFARPLEGDAVDGLLASGVVFDPAAAPVSDRPGRPATPTASAPPPRTRAGSTRR